MQNGRYSGIGAKPNQCRAHAVAGSGIKSGKGDCRYSLLLGYSPLRFAPGTVPPPAPGKVAPSRSGNSPPFALGMVSLKHPRNIPQIRLRPPFTKEFECRFHRFDVEAVPALSTKERKRELELRRGEKLIKLNHFVFVYKKLSDLLRRHFTSIGGEAAYSVLGAFIGLADSLLDFSSVTRLTAEAKKEEAKHE